jgi:reactive intermediate/imine deaminase
VFENLTAIAEAAGTSLQNAVKVTVYLTDLKNFGAVNEVMQEYFEQPYPARAALGAAALPLGAEVEADAILAL